MDYTRLTKEEEIAHANIIHDSNSLEDDIFASRKALFFANYNLTTALAKRYHRRINSKYYPVEDAVNDALVVLWVTTGNYSGDRGTRLSTILYPRIIKCFQVNSAYNKAVPAIPNHHYSQVAISKKAVEYDYKIQTGEKIELSKIEYIRKELKLAEKSWSDKSIYDMIGMSLGVISASHTTENGELAIDSNDKRVEKEFSHIIEPDLESVIETLPLLEREIINNEFFNKKRMKIADFLVKYNISNTTYRTLKKLALQKIRFNLEKNGIKIERENTKSVLQLLDDIKLNMTFYSQKERDIFEKDLSEQTERFSSKPINKTLEDETREYRFVLADKDDFFDYMDYIFDQYESNHPRFASSEE